ncbi:MAG: hypothetical protein N2490_03240 [Ignavibacteria bacterium]|nr:hypothetical protein [Ignavibacteria bacterium]
MKFIVGKDKFPFIEVNNGIYLQILPVTKYQFERYLLENRPSSIDYNQLLNQLLKDNPRISPSEIRKEGITKMLITHLNFSEVVEYAKWMDGKVPDYEILCKFDKEYLNLKLSDIRESLADLSSQIDIRFWKIFDAMEKNKITKLSELYKEITGAELCYKNSAESEICAKRYGRESLYEIVGDNPYGVRWIHSFRIIKKIEEE